MKKFIFGILCIGLVALFTPVSFASDGPETTKECVFDVVDFDNSEVVVADATNNVDRAESSSVAVSYIATKSLSVELPEAPLIASIDENRHIDKHLNKTYTEPINTDWNVPRTKF